MKHIEDIVFEDTAFPIKIVRDRAPVIDKTTAATRAFHEAVEIKYFYEGEATLLIGSETVEASAGDVIVINPYEFHATVSMGKENAGKYHLIMIGLDFFEGAIGVNINLRRLFLEKGARIKRKIKATESLAATLKNMADSAYSLNEYSRLKLYGLTASLFAELLADFSDKQEAECDDGSFNHYATIEPAIIIIRDSYSRNLTVDELAHSCRISKYHFCRIFKSVMGMGAIQYLNAHRLKIANTLLKGSDQSIGEISELCGFEDTSYFCRIYKKCYGKTPMQTKKESNS